LVEKQPCAIQFVNCINCLLTIGADKQVLQVLHLLTVPCIEGMPHLRASHHIVNTTLEYTTDA